jgi:thymidine kinase
MTGGLEVICGPMFSGKTGELLRRLRRHEIAGRKVILLRPEIDVRYSENEVVSHNGDKMWAEYVPNEFNFFSSSNLMNKTLGSDVDIVGIDEIQFFDPAFINDIMIISYHKRLIITGLDTNYRFEPFGMVPQLMSLADKVDKLTAICNVCGEEATRTQRLVDGKPASISGEEVLVGGNETYQARCRDCYEIRP